MRGSAIAGRRYERTLIVGCCGAASRLTPDLERESDDVEDGGAVDYGIHRWRVRLRGKRLLKLCWMMPWNAQALLTAGRGSIAADFERGGKAVPTVYRDITKGLKLKVRLVCR